MEKNVYINNLKYIQSNINEMLLEATPNNVPAKSAAAVGVFGIFSTGLDLYYKEKNMKIVLEWFAKGGAKLSEKAVRHLATISRALSKNPSLTKKIWLHLAKISVYGTKGVGATLSFLTAKFPSVMAAATTTAAKGLAIRSAVIGGVKTAAGGISAAVGGTVGWPIAIAIVAAVTVSALIGRKVTLNKSIAEAIANVKSAKESGKYKDFQKYITSLQKIRDNDSFWSKLTTAQEARDISDSSLNTFKKGYITIGICMILCSIISLIAFSFNVDTFKPLIDAVKKLDWKGILVGIGKIVAITALAIPAVIGVAMIFVGMTGFPEKGAAPAVLAIFSPVVQLSNNIIGRYMESLT